MIDPLSLYEKIYVKYVMMVLSIVTLNMNVKKKDWRPRQDSHLHLWP